MGWIGQWVVTEWSDWGGVTLEGDECDAMMAFMDLDDRLVPWWESSRREGKSSEYFSPDSSRSRVYLSIFGSSTVVSRG